MEGAAVDPRLVPPVLEASVDGFLSSRCVVISSTSTKREIGDNRRIGKCWLIFMSLGFRQVVHPSPCVFICFFFRQNLKKKTMTTRLSSHKPPSALICHQRGLLWQPFQVEAIDVSLETCCFRVTRSSPLIFSDNRRPLESGKTLTTF